MISLINHDSSEGEQWGRYNLPRFMDEFPSKKKPLKSDFPATFDKVGIPRQAAPSHPVYL